MSEQPTKEIIIEDLALSCSVIYTRSIMTIEKRINVSVHIAMVVFGTLLLFLVFGFLINDVDSKTVGWVLLIMGLGGGLTYYGIRERSYRYEINKLKGQVTCQWDGFLGTSVGKSETLYSLKDIDYVRIDQLRSRGHDSFKVKIILQSGEKLDVPSGDTLNKCMEHANMYRDFLELEKPIKLP
jgi:hypothetical protein